MIAPLTPNTQAILLLTAPLEVGRSASSADLLTLGEYNRLARLLRQKLQQPADLLGPEAAAVIEACAPAFAESRLKALLGRGFLLSQAVDRWRTRVIWVVSRADTQYPSRLKARLKEEAPPILYGCGDPELLNSGGFAVVGSRQVDDALLEYSAQVGQLIARSGRSLVSGGARGIDQAAMRGAAQAGGTVVGVLADSLDRAALARDHREGLMDGRLVLVSPFDPAAGFNVGHAMRRNKVIYALADAALVVSSDFNKGGTWAGAVEQLEKYHCGPLFVRQGNDAAKGNGALLRKGALPWKEPADLPSLERFLDEAKGSIGIYPTQEVLPLGVLAESRAAYGDEAVTSTESAVEQGPPELNEAASTLQKVAFDLLRNALAEAKTEAEVAAYLDITKAQAKSWIEAMCKSGRLEKVKRSRPARYRAAASSNLLS